MSWLVPPRRPSRELLDDPDLPGGEMQRSLEDIDLVHRRWGGSRALVRHLAPRLGALGRPGSVLDVGAGSGAVARRLRACLSGGSVEVRVVALDLQWRHLAAGRSFPPREPLPLVGGDAFRLPFPARAFDFGVSTFFFHHFSPAENRSILGELSRVSRHGFAVLDLRRHVVPELVLRLAGGLLFRANTSILDGIASVRQAYTMEEARSIARAVTPTARTIPVFPYGLLVTGGV